jgi:hypothetical protein
MHNGIVIPGLVAWRFRPFGWGAERLLSSAETDCYWPIRDCRRPTLSGHAFDGRPVFS